MAIQTKIEKYCDKFISNNFDKRDRKKDDSLKFEWFVNSMHCWHYSSQSYNSKPHIGKEISLGTAQGGDAFFITIDNQLFSLKDNIELTLDANKQNIISVKGSKNQKIQDLEDEMMSKAETEEQRVKIWKQIIAQYSDSYVAGEALFMLVGNQSCSVEESDSLLKTLSRDIQKSSSGRLIENFIARQKNMIPGEKAPYWAAKEESPYWLGQNMTTTSLSDFKGKVLLMDAWASWCTPCREAFKRMKPFCEQYHNQGFEIVGVNVDLKRTAEWQKAIKEDSIESWHHVQIATDLRSATPFSYKPNDIYGNYYIQAVPVRILIDKKGIIRGHWVGFNEDKEDAIYKLILELLAEKD